MRHVKLLACVTLAALTTAWCVAQQPGTDLDRFQGAWRVVALEAAGQKIKDAEKLDLTISFTGDKYAEKVKGKTVEEGTIQLRPDKSPRQIDIRIGTGKDKGKTQLGIYKLEGDTATFAIAPADSTERPTAFTTQAGSKYSVQVFRREKK